VPAFKPDYGEPSADSKRGPKSAASSKDAAEATASAPMEVTRTHTSDTLSDGGTEVAGGVSERLRVRLGVADFLGQVDPIEEFAQPLAGEHLVHASVGVGKNGHLDPQETDGGDGGHGRRCDPPGGFVRERFPAFLKNGVEL
jgi:hypothetical protein